MNLRQWIEAEPAARREFEAECYRRGTPCQVGQLADEAAKLLAQELAHLTQVTDVAAGEDLTAKGSRLVVSTLLPESEKLRVIPEEFAGFPVVQFGVAERKSEFLGRLEFALCAVELPRAEIDAWLTQFGESLNSIGSVYYLETTGRWIAEVLVTSLVKSGLVGKPFVDLHRELWEVLTAFFKKFDPGRGGPADAAAMQRLRASLQRTFSKHGVTVTFE